MWIEDCIPEPIIQEKNSFNTWSRLSISCIFWYSDHFIVFKIDKTRAAREIPLAARGGGGAVFRCALSDFVLSTWIRECSIARCHVLSHRKGRFEKASESKEVP